MQYWSSLQYSQFWAFLASDWPYLAGVHGEKPVEKNKEANKSSRDQHTCIPAKPCKIQPDLLSKVPPTRDRDIYLKHYLDFDLLFYFLNIYITQSMHFFWCSHIYLSSICCRSCLLLMDCLYKLCPTDKIKVTTNRRI